MGRAYISRIGGSKFHIIRFAAMCNRWGRGSSTQDTERARDNSIRTNDRFGYRCRTDALPIIQFILTDDNQELMHIAQVHPRDYINNDGRRAFVELLVNIENSCELNPRILKKLLIHFDAVNDRVGFGDPLNEF